MTIPTSHPNSDRVNLHGTAVVIGTRGIVFLGPSGSGKSSMAFACLDAARNIGCFSALVADDQVLIERAGQYAMARRPPAIAGLLEIRYSGIVTLASIDATLLHLAVILAVDAERLPPAGESFRLPVGIDLPLLKIERHNQAPLAVLAALEPKPTMGADPRYPHF